MEGLNDSFAAKDLSRVMVLLSYARKEVEIELAEVADFIQEWSV